MVAIDVIDLLTLLLTAFAMGCKVGCDVKK